MVRRFTVMENPPTPADARGGRQGREVVDTTTDRQKDYDLYSGAWHKWKKTKNMLVSVGLASCALRPSWSVAASVATNYFGNVARCKVARMQASKRQESYAKGSEKNVF